MEYIAIIPHELYALLTHAQKPKFHTDLGMRLKVHVHMINRDSGSFSVAHLGQKAGYLGSAYFIGNFAGSMTWGWLSDILGRRPVMLLGVCGTIFSELLFGFSQNFGWAIAGRFLWGLLNGNLGVVKTYVSEVRIR